MAHDSNSNILTFPASRSRTAAPAVTRDWALLDFLRTGALRARLFPQLAPEQACALIATDPTISAERYAQAFFRALAQASTRSLNLHHRGVRHATPDEEWLEGLICALQRGDSASASLMMASRVKTLGRHRMFALTSGLACALGALDLSEPDALAS